MKKIAHHWSSNVSDDLHLILRHDVVEDLNLRVEVGHFNLNRMEEVVRVVLMGEAALKLGNIFFGL